MGGVNEGFFCKSVLIRFYEIPRLIIVCKLRINCLDKYSCTLVYWIHNFHFLAALKACWFT